VPKKNMPFFNPQPAMAEDKLLIGGQEINCHNAS
jgi:hypothetical protein